MAPSWHHPLGTDFLGQDILTQIVIGTRPVLEVGLLTAIFAVGFGVIVGLVTGYLGGAVDMALMRLADVFLTIPGLPLVIVVASIIRTSSPLILAAIIAITAWAGLARAVPRPGAIPALGRLHRSGQGPGTATTPHDRATAPAQCRRHYVAINFLLAVTAAIYAEVGLFVLGVAPVSGINWGIMINLAMGNGALYTSKSMLYLFTPMAAIVFLQVALVFFTRALDQLFNPRLRVQ